MGSLTRTEGNSPENRRGSGSDQDSGEIGPKSGIPRE